MADERMIRGSLVISVRAREVRCEQWTVPVGTTLIELIQASPLCQSLSLDAGHCIWGIWGRRHLAGYLLQENDRVELYRPLRVDPKIARQERFRKQGVRTTGLFAHKRPGTKSGY